MLACASTCGHVLAYAGICWHMLGYAGVCEIYASICSRSLNCDVWGRTSLGELGVFATSIHCDVSGDFQNDVSEML